MTDSPLSPCPGTPNCEHETRTFADQSPEALFEKAQDTLGDMGPVELSLRDDAPRIDAVFRVALVFKDDVAIAVTPLDTDGDDATGGGGAALHIRSASRVGRSDLGVNQRRVARFFRTLQNAL